MQVLIAKDASRNRSAKLSAFLQTKNADGLDCVGVALQSGFERTAAAITALLGTDADREGERKEKGDGELSSGLEQSMIATWSSSTSPGSGASHASAALHVGSEAKRAKQVMTLAEVLSACPCAVRGCM